MALAQKKYLSCLNCGQTSPPAEFAAEVQQLAKDAGWLVGGRGHNTSDRLRPRGWDDFCPNCRAEHELVYCEVLRKGGEKCTSQAIVVLTRDDVVVNVCAFHEWVTMKEMLVATDTLVTVQRVPE